MASNTPVSIIIRTLGIRLPLLEAALGSLLEQDHGDLQIVVIEDGNDAAETLVRQMAARVERSVVYRSVPKGSMAKAGNAGVAASTGQYLGFLDDDDELFPNHATALASALDAHPKIPAVFGHAWQVEAETVSGSAQKLREIRRMRVGRDKFSKVALTFANTMPIQSIMFRRAIFDKYGGFDEDLIYLEDWDLWLRICADNEFLPVREITSLFRVPADRGNRWERARLHAPYREMIRQKQRGMSFAVLGNDLVDEYSRVARMCALGGRPLRWYIRLREFHARLLRRPLP